MLKFIWKLLIASSLTVLIACGGGGGGSQPSSDGEGSITSTKFSVVLSDVDVRRVSNGNEVVVDISNINSEELTLTQ